MPKTSKEFQEDTLVKDEIVTKEPPMYQVVLLNDDYTTMEFVVFVLQTVFGHSLGEANGIMLAVHQNGRGIAGVFTREIAETKIATVEHMARQNEYPLRCVMDPVE